MSGWNALCVWCVRCARVKRVTRVLRVLHRPVRAHGLCDPLACHFSSGSTDCRNASGLNLNSSSSMPSVLSVFCTGAVGRREGGVSGQGRAKAEMSGGRDCVSLRYCAVVCGGVWSISAHFRRLLLCALPPSSSLCLYQKEACSSPEPYTRLLLEAAVVERSASSLSLSPHPSSRFTPSCVCVLSPTLSSLPRLSSPAQLSLNITFAPRSAP